MKNTTLRLKEELEKKYPNIDFRIKISLNYGHIIKYQAWKTEPEVKALLNSIGFYKFLLTRIYSENLLKTMAVAWCERQNIPFRDVPNSYDPYLKCHVLEIVIEILKNTSFEGMNPIFIGYRESYLMIHDKINEMILVKWKEEINGKLYKSDIAALRKKYNPNI